MSGGLSNQPKILRGAFVEFGVSVPPLMVVFQFNPLTINRSRSATLPKTDTAADKAGAQNVAFIQQLKKRPDVLLEFRSGQITVNPETLNFDIRLDATDNLDEGNPIAQQFGIAPQLSTLELMMLPKSQNLLGAGVAALLGGAPDSFAFFDNGAKNPPVILFVWGRKKVLPVNMTNMSIKEEEFSTDLNPIRATVTISLEVIEGPNAPFVYTQALKESMSLLNLANIPDIAKTIVPV